MDENANAQPLESNSLECAVQLWRR